MIFFSSRQVIEAIAAAVRATQGATLLDVDPGQVQVHFWLNYVKLVKTFLSGIKENIPILVDQSDSVHVRWRPRQHC